MTAYEELWGIAEDHFGLIIVDRDCPRVIRGASRALRAEHENAGPRQIAFGDWERGAVAGFEAPLHPSPPPRSHPPGYAEVPRHENRTKSHERTACQERTISFTPADASRSPVLGCEKYFVSFRETFVSRRAAEPRGCCVFVVRAKRREAPHPLHRAPPLPFAPCTWFSICRSRAWKALAGFRSSPCR